MEKKTDKYNLIRLRTVSAVFLVFIFLIPILTLLRMGLKHIPVGQYGENILGKYKLIGFNTAISEALSGGEYMESNEVLLGKDGWLFYKVTNDGTPLYDYMGINSFTDDELASAYGSFMNTADDIFYHDAISSKIYYSENIKLAVLTIPNKEQVYSEYMPDTVEKINDTSRLAQLTDYVRKRGHEPLTMDRFVPFWTYTDISDDFISVHNDYPLYYKTDTHWTDAGAYLALTKVMDSLDRRPIIGVKSDENEPKADVLAEVRFMQEPGFVGDLTKISATQERYTDVRYVIDPDSIPDKYKTHKKLLIVGDSFGDAMQHVAKHCFKEVRFLDIKEYGGKFEYTLDTYDPDLVILECVERYLPRLTELNKIE